MTTDRGHANAFGNIGWIDFREPPDAWLRVTESRGGLLSINHPLAGDCRWRWPMDGRPPLAEVWHTSWDRNAPLPLAWWAGWGAASPVGGSDFHRHGQGKMPGAPTTWVEAEDDDVLGALAAGRIALSWTPSGPILLRHGDSLLAIDADGMVIWGPEGPRETIRGSRMTLPGGDGPWWLVGLDGRVAALVA